MLEPCSYQAQLNKINSDSVGSVGVWNEILSYSSHSGFVQRQRFLSVLARVEMLCTTA